MKVALPPAVFPSAVLAVPLGWVFPLGSHGTELPRPNQGSGHHRIHPVVDEPARVGGPVVRWVAPTGVDSCAPVPTVRTPHRALPVPPQSLIPALSRRPDARTSSNVLGLSGAPTHAGPHRV